MDRINHRLFQPLLYQLATGILSEGRLPRRSGRFQRNHKNVAVLLANVTAFDLENRRVTAARPIGPAVELEYDSLIVASGESKPFKYRDLGSMASIARSRDERTISMLQASARVVAASTGIKPGEEDIHKLAEHDPRLASTISDLERDVDQ